MVRMIHLNDEIDIKELPEEMILDGVDLKNRFRRDFESGIYISSEEFRKRAIDKVNKFCDNHGIL